MSTADHPQTDDQSEVAIKIIQKLLRPFDSPMMSNIAELVFYDTLIVTYVYSILE